MAQLAAFVAEQYARVAFMSTRELAAAAGVSLATVVRFPAVLGYRSFDDLRTHIQDRVNVDLTGVDRWRTLTGTSRSYSGLLRRILDADGDPLRVLARDFREGEFERALRMIVDAERVTILGFRYVSPLTVYFAYSLGKIKAGVLGFTHGDSSLYDRLRLMDKGDVLVAIAFARYPADFVELVRYAHTRRVRIVAITDSPLSPVLPIADAALFAKASLLDFVGSLAAPAALINCIVSAAGVQLGGAALRRLEALEDAAAAAGVYVHAAGSANRAARRVLAWDEARGPMPKRRGARR